tara:strand:- start:268 stop:549 length:282 start_codon:yes stop_codon:yes gene_type:complete
MIIISKIELDTNSEVCFVDFGYTSDQAIINQINQDYDHSLGVYIADNRTNLELGNLVIDSFFTITPIVFEARIEASTVNGLGITEITSLSQLI